MSGVFHYTNAQGLFGMLRARELWVTRSAFLNDPSEVAYAAARLKSKLEHELLQWHLSGVPLGDVDVITRAISLLDEQYINPLNQQLPVEEQAYVASFSHDDRRLSLWRMYAGKTGYCVQFDSNELLRWVEPGPSGLVSMDHEEKSGRDVNWGLGGEIYEIAYDDSEIDKNVSQIVDLSTHGDSAAMDLSLASVFRELAKTKNPAFEDEREIRLTVRDSNCTPFEEVRINQSGGLIPYKKLAFPHSAIKSITLAPGSDQQRGEVALKSLLSDGGRGAWSAVKILVTDIPFSW